MISPISLTHGIVVPGTGSQQFRLLHQPLRHQSNRSLPFWVLQGRDISEDPWLDIYAFCTTVEFAREDYEVMSYMTSKIESSIFVQMIICVRAILSSELSKEELAHVGEDEGGDVRVVGRMLLTKRDIKKRVGDEVEKLEVFETEEQRVRAFKKYFGIELTGEEREGIRGRATEIR